MDGGEIMTKTHGKSKDKFYQVWNGMKQRCYNVNNKNYHNYGGRGIKVCDEWLNDFTSFYNWSMNNGYKDGLQIDRIDNNKDYEPSNCRWVNRYINNNNRRNNILFTYNNKTMSLRAWCRHLNVCYKTCMTRYYRGHTIEECLNLSKLSDHRKDRIRYNSKLYKYEDGLYSISNLSEKLNISRWKLQRDIKKGILPKGVTKYNE